MDKLFIIIPLIFPYIMLGEGLSNVVLAIVGGIYVLINFKYITKVKKSYLILASMFTVVLFINNLVMNNSLYAYTGLANYMNLIIYYLYYNILLAKHKNKTIEWGIGGVTLASIIFIILDVCFFNKRLAGNIGYANTYGLLLLITFILSTINKYKYSSYTNIIMIAAILLSGSRTTMVLLISYLLVYFVVFKRKELKLEDIIKGVIVYLLIVNLRIVGFILSPIAINLINITIEFVGKSKKKQGIMFLALASAFLLIPNNTLDRIKNISFTNGSLQERLLTYGDSLKYIVNNFMGKGLNSYSFTYTNEASAFYDNKYLHNSFLDLAYEGGWLAFLLIVVILIYLIYLCYREIKAENTKIYLVMILYIMLHSCLEFNFEFSTILIMLAIIVNLIEEKHDKPKVVITAKATVIAKGLLIICIGIFSYLAVYEGLIFMDNVNLLKMANKLPLKDYRCYLFLADNLIEEDNVNYEEVKTYLTKAEELNDDYATIKWDLAYVNSKLENYDEAIKYQWRVIEEEKYYFDAYKTMEEILNEAYYKTKDNKYKESIAKLETVYYTNLETINKNYVYLRNQLPVSYEEVLKMEYEVYE